MYKTMNEIEIEYKATNENHRFTDSWIMGRFKDVSDGSQSSRPTMGQWLNSATYEQIIKIIWKGIMSSDRFKAEKQVTKTQTGRGRVFIHSHKF